MKRRSQFPSPQPALTGLTAEHLREAGNVLKLKGTCQDGAEAPPGTSRIVSHDRRVEDILINEGHRAQRYLDLAGTMFVVLDRNGKVSLINKKGCEILGYPREEIVGKDWFENFVPERTRLRVKKVFSCFITGVAHAPKHYENRVLTRDGQERTIAWHNGILRSESGEITGTLSSGSDITEQKRRVERLESLHALMGALLAPGSLQEKLGRVTAGLVLIFGADVARIWRVQPGVRCDVRSSSAGDMAPEQASAEHESRLKLVGSSGRYPRPDGDQMQLPFDPDSLIRMLSEGAHSVVINDMGSDAASQYQEWARGLGLVSFGGYPIVSNLGKIIGVMALYGKQPITPEESMLLESLATTTSHMFQAAIAEEHVLEARNRFENLVKHIPDAIYSSLPDVTRTTTYMSPKWEDWAGHATDDFRREPATWLKSIHPEDRSGAVEAYLLACGEKRPYLSEYRVVHKDTGDVRFLRDRGVPILDEEGNVSRYDGVITDNTEMKMAEDERAQMQVQLLQAQKLESIGRLAAGIAHEINTPCQYVGDNTHFLRDSFGSLAALLSRYRGLLDSAVSGEVATDQLEQTARSLEKETDLEFLSEEIPKSIEQSLDGIARISKIVRAMKDFSHPPSGDKVPVDINNAIQSTVTVARNEWKYVSDVELDLDPALPNVPCFQDELNQVVLNIIVNAAHAIQDAIGEDAGRKGTITITTRQDGDWAEIRIADSGTGIPESARSKVFEPFFTTKEVGRGTGQGLAIARSAIVDKHRGTIDFESEENAGTTFIIRLPMVESGPAEEPRHETAGSVRE